jgi:glycosyltransferase involved in cell wall biosynthesis
MTSPFFGQPSAPAISKQVQAPALPRSLRVLEVTARFFPYSGGVENHVYQISRRLAKIGVDVTVLTTDPQNRLPKFEVIEGVKISRVRAWPARQDYYFAPGMVRMIMEGGWDVVHVQCYHTLVPPLAMLAALRAKIPYVLTFHGGGSSSQLRQSLRGMQRRLLRPLLFHAERLVTIAQFETPFYSKELHIPERKFFLNPNGADLPQLVGQPAQIRSGTLIASVGRLEHYKGHHRVIDAMPKIIEAIPDARLWIAGEGPYEAELRSLAKKRGVENRVEIRAIPPSEREMMAREISQVSLVILMSEFETHPISILEAISLGRPVLVADTSGLRELAQQGLAQSIPLNSPPETIAQAVVEQIQHPLKPVDFHLPTWDECARNLVELYTDVAGRG